MSISVLRLMITILIGITVQFSAVGSEDEIRFIQRGGNEIWLHDGQLLAVPKDNCIQLFDINTRSRSELILPKDSLPDDYRLYLYDEGIIAMGDANTALTEKNNHYYAHHISFWSWEGIEVYKIADDDLHNSSDRDFSWVKPYWVDSDLAILNAGLYIFKLDLTTGEIEKIYDNGAAEEKYGRESVYWETRDEFCAVSNGIFYFLAHDQNTATGVLMKYENDKCEALFAGRQFVDFMINEDDIITKELVDNENVERLWYSDKTNLNLSEIIEGENLSYCIDNENFAAAAYDANKDLVKVLVLDTKADRIAHYELANMSSENYGRWIPEFMGVKFVGKVPYFVFREQGGGGFLACNDNGEVKKIMGADIRLGDSITNYPRAGYYIRIINDDEKNFELLIEQLCIQ